MTTVMTTVDKERLRASLTERPRLQISVAAGQPLAGYRESAVLVLLVDDALIFTVRPVSMPTHAGQISFPGGKREPADRDLVATAVREAEEELGIDGARLDVLGLLDDVPTPTGWVITPVVAIATKPFPLRPAPGEVAAVFDCPVGELGQPKHFRDGGKRSFLGVEYEMPEYLWQEHRIWGATARITWQLLKLIVDRNAQ